MTGMRARLAIREPSACGACGITRRRHMQIWREGVGWHNWIMPDQALIRDRMMRRRTNPDRWIPAADPRTMGRKWKT